MARQTTPSPRWPRRRALRVSKLSRPKAVRSFVHSRVAVTSKVSRPTSRAETDETNVERRRLR